MIWLQTPTVFGVGGGKFLLAMECKREWRKLHNEERNNLYSSPNIVRVIKIEKNVTGGACSAYGGEERCIQGFGGAPELKIPLGRQA